MRRAAIVRLACAAVAAVLASCGGGGGDEADTPPTQPSAAEAPAADEPEDAQSGDPAGGSEPEESDERAQLSADERVAVQAVREYVRALDRRDGDAVCALLVPGALDAVELPKERGDCGRSLGASIGYRDPRGLPVWEGARVAEIVSVEIGEGEAKVVATTVTRFADRDELSIEDDVVYLQRAAEGWLIAKPSTTLYRAVGIADVPPSVLAPPG